MAKDQFEKIATIINKQSVEQQKILFQQIKSLITENVLSEGKKLQDEANDHQTFAEKINGN